MLNPTVDELSEEVQAPVPEQETPAPPATKPAKSKPKAAQSKAESKLATNGPVYLLLSANGKYKELNESELHLEAASVLKDPTLRLVKGSYLVPQISFNLTEE